MGVSSTRYAVCQAGVRLEECSSLEKALNFVRRNNLENYYIRKLETAAIHIHSDNDGLCPNSILNWHGKVELISQEDSRGQYKYCPKCRWYTGIEKESRDSLVSQLIFIETLMEALDDFKGVIDLTQLNFGSSLTAEDEWHQLGERLQKYGNNSAADLDISYRNELITKFELKGWKDRTEDDFFSSHRAFVNISETRDAAKFDGYIAFVTLQDRSVICTRALDIEQEWNKQKETVRGNDIKNKTFEKFADGVLVVKAPDKQKNERYVLSINYKIKHCKHLQAVTPRIVEKIMVIDSQSKMTDISL